MYKRPKITIRWGVKIALRDGVLLDANVYLPGGLGAPAPTIVTLTPYTSDTIHERGVYFATHGLPFAAVDVRGRGNSGGAFRPFIQEAHDGFDVVEWLAWQPYCNGQIAMCGGSYNGYNQWATAKERPPHLVTIVPVAAPCLGLDFPMRRNIFYPYVLQWLALTRGRTSNDCVFSDQSLWSTALREWYVSGRPFRNLDNMLGSPSSVFQEWLSHSERDEFWDAYNPTQKQYGQIEIPILTVTGSYDDDQLGALEHYKTHMRNAHPTVQAQHFLVIGPWDHARTRTPSREFGGVTFGPASLLDLQRLYLEWYEWTMLDRTKPDFLKRAVAYYVMGAERWRYADSLDQVTARYEPYYLDSTGIADGIYTSGCLGAVPGHGIPDEYVYDPRNICESVVDAEVQMDAGSLVDQQLGFALSGCLFVYHSYLFTDDVEVTGFFRLSVWLSIDRPDTDFYVSVHEIDTRGCSIRLSTDAIRARYREGGQKHKMIDTRDPLRYDFDQFTFVSRLIKRNHRLRLMIAPIGRLVDATFTQKNYNSGGIVAEESSESGAAVTVRLFHDAMHPSTLYVPIGQPVFPEEPQVPVEYFTSRIAP